MLRHTGRKRTFRHNLRLAVLLSATAGIVNVAGFISFSIFTTNVTGHVASFAKALSEGNFRFMSTIFIWMFLFLLGAFLSSLLIHSVGKTKAKFSHAVPLLLELLILLAVGYVGEEFGSSYIVQHVLAGSLLFAMGMQNAMVSMVSGFVVRTTHLTGLFTDLGIELSQLLVKRGGQKELSRKTILHSSIILMFIGGGIAGGYLYQILHFKVFIVAAGILLIALLYDSTRINLYILRRKFRKKTV